MGDTRSGEAPDVFGEIIGCRTWAVEGHDIAGPVQLVSLSRRTVWPTDGWLYATCETCQPDQIPNPDCRADARERHGCGIHAARHRPHLHGIGYNRTEILDLWPERDTDLIVIGEVALAGRVIEGTMGWRAQMARVSRLWVPHLEWRVGNELKDLYNVPVELTNLYEEPIDGHR